jgi:hypothetical protein
MNLVFLKMNFQIKGGNVSLIILKLKKSKFFSRLNVLEIRVFYKLLSRGHVLLRFNKKILVKIMHLH